MIVCCIRFPAVSSGLILLTICSTSGSLSILPKSISVKSSIFLIIGMLLEMLILCKMVHELIILAAFSSE